MKTHELKCKHSYWHSIAAKRKTYELRKNDRDYEVGDLLVLYRLAEADPGDGSLRTRDRAVCEVLGLQSLEEVGAVLKEAVPSGYVVLSIQLLAVTKWA